MHRKKQILLFLLSLFAFSGFTQNQSFVNVAPSWAVEPLVTDRPDQTESSVTVPRKSLQIETGFIYEHYAEDQYVLENMALGTTLLRYGVLENFELRLGSSYQINTLKPASGTADTTQQGIAPISVGIKVYIVQEKGIWPELSLLADFTLNQLTALDFRPTYNYSTIQLAASHTLSDRFGLGYNLGYAYNGEDPKGYFLYSLVLGISVSERIGAFVESYGNFDPGAIPRHRFDAGFTYLISQNIQVDISGGFGPKDTVSMGFVSMGLSWRFPE
ncbi:MAG: transporter [Bacteroidetes bacterium]|nr:transporter [Bacteroidota bacterium]